MKTIHCVLKAAVLSSFVVLAGCAGDASEEPMGSTASLSKNKKEQRRDDRRDTKQERRDDRHDTREERRDDRRDSAPPVYEPDPWPVTDPEDVDGDEDGANGAADEGEGEGEGEGDGDADADADADENADA